MIRFIAAISLLFLTIVNANAIGQKPFNGFGLTDGTWLNGLSGGTNFQAANAVAAGTTVNGATQLSPGVAMWAITQAASGANGVDLPVCLAGTFVSVYNSSSVNVVVYPSPLFNMATGSMDTIQNSTSSNLGNQTSTLFTCNGVGNWTIGSSAGGGGGGGSSSVTRAQIPSTILNQTQFVSNGYRTANDLGNGCVYSSVGATSTGLQAVTSANGVLYNLIFPNGIASVGCFGAYANDGATLISSADVTANSSIWRGTYTVNVTSWDTVAVQEAVYAAFAGLSTHGVINWNTIGGHQSLNETWYLPNGKYGITSRVTANMQGGVMSFQSREYALLDWVGSQSPGDYVLYCDGCSYSLFINPSVASNGQFGSWSNGTQVAAWAFDWSGSIASLKTQQNTIINFWCSTNINGRCGVMSPSGGGAQGDTNQFFNAVCVGNQSDYCWDIEGDNALNNAFFGLDEQGFQHDGIQIHGGNASVYNAHDENENLNQATGSPIMTQYTLYGASYHVYTQVNGSGPAHMSAYRSEAGVLMYGFSGSGAFYNANNGLTITGGSTIANDVLSWASASSFQEGQVVQGGTDGRVFMLADAGGTDWENITSYIGNVITDSSASYTINQWAGYNLLARFGGNSFTESCDIVSNTATTITLDAGCSAASTQQEYQIVGLTGAGAPSWNGAATGIQAAFTGTSQGFGTVAGSTCIFVPSSVGGRSVGDYVAIPNARVVGAPPAGPAAMPTVFVAKLVTSGSCGSGFGNWIVNRAPNVTLGGAGQAPGYVATPITDGTKGLRWIDFEWIAVGPANSLQDVTINEGTIENGGTTINTYVANPNTISGSYNSTMLASNLAAPGQYQLGGVGGPKPTLTGTCATGNQIGGNTAGTFTATCNTSTVILTFASSAPNGWACFASDQTTSSDSLKQSAKSTTACTMIGTVAASDVISFSATAY